MASAYERTRKDGTSAWYARYLGHDGKWKSERMRGVKTEAQAKKLAFELEQGQERLAHGLNGGTLWGGTFGELCHWAYDAHFSRLRGAQSDLYRIVQHAGDPKTKRTTWLGELPARQVTSAKLEQYFLEMSSTITARGKAPSPKTINRLRATFSGVFSVATRFGHWMQGDNPAQKTLARPEQKATHDVFSAHEVGPVLQALSPYWRGLFATCFLSGIRRGEAFGLQKRDVDLARRTILIQRSHEHDTTKGGSAEPVPIHEDLVPYIAEWLESPGPYLFPNHEGGRRSKNQHCERILRTAMARAGIVEHYDHTCRRKGCGHVERHDDDATRRCPACNMKLWAVGRARPMKFHETRHTLATLALMSGASLQGVQKILRHKDPRLTVETYGHLTSAFLATEVNRVSLPGVGAPEQRGPQLNETSENGKQVASQRIDPKGVSESLVTPVLRDRETGKLEGGESCKVA